MKNKTAEKYEKQIVRLNRELRLVKLSLMKISTHCQRELRPTWVDYLVADFDLDKMGVPEVSHRDGLYYVMDGQHRIEAVKRFLGNGWQDQHIQCWVAEGLTEEQEAEYFLSLNDRKAVDGYAKFRVGERAGRPDETAVSAIAKEVGVKIAQQKNAGTCSAVGTLMRVFKRNGPTTLKRGLALAYTAFGDYGLEAKVIDGLSLVCHRYNGVLDDASAAKALSTSPRGVKGLVQDAAALREKIGAAVPTCIAACAVDRINKGSGRKHKLTPWLKD